WSQAQMYLEKAHRLLPEHPTLRYDLARCYIDQAAYPKALSLLKTAHQRHSLDLKSQVLLVSLCMQLKTEISYAKEALAQLVVAHPVNPQVLVLQGELALREGAFETVDAIARRLMLLPQNAIIEGHWLMGQKFFQMALTPHTPSQQKEIWLNEAKKSWQWILERYPTHEPSWESYLVVSLHLVNGQWVHYLRTLEWLIERYAHQQPEVLHMMKRQAKKALSTFKLDVYGKHIDALGR
ncbi:MAG: tetratricopeptide repeat protein, partial [Vampirovibrionales bacterium]